MRKKNTLQILDFFLQVYRYKDFLAQSVARDLKKKYKRSAIGYLWTVLHPLLMMVILSVVFSHIFKMKPGEYSLILFPALLIWNFFSSTTMMSLHSIRNNASLFGQVPIPKYIFVVSIACSNLFNFVISIIPLILLIVFFQAKISPYFIFFPIVVLPVIILTLAISIILSVLNVFFDDTQHLSEVGLQILYFLSPILYSLVQSAGRDPIFPEHIKQNIMTFNPLAYPIESFRSLVIHGNFPDGIHLLISYLISLGFLYVALKISKRYDNLIMYYL